MPEPLVSASPEGGVEERTVYSNDRGKNDEVSGSAALPEYC